MEKRKKKNIIILAVLLAVLFPASVYADFGPKDHLTVYVKNAPGSGYCLDLLQKEKGDYQNLTPDEISGYDPAVTSHLESMQDEGWYPALWGGTTVPLFGNLTGKADGEYMVHTFSYFGVPSSFRIIIADRQGVVSVSEEVHRKSLHSSVVVDYLTGEVTSPPVWVGYAVQYISSLIPTLIIEGIILMLLGYSLKKNMLLFVSVNALTQIFLTAFAGHSVITGGPTMAFLRFFPHEMAILVSETLIYSFFLRQNNEKPKTMQRTHKALYGILANLASWILWMLTVGIQFDGIMSLL